MNTLHKVKTIGRREYISLPDFGISNIEAKIDTGAYTSSLHVENIEIRRENAKDILYLTLNLDGEKEFRFEDFAQKKIKNSFGEMEERYVIRTHVSLAKKKIVANISLSNRDNMRYPMLIGRRILKGRFLIDVNQIHTGGI